MKNLELQKRANDVRKGIVTAVHSAKAGHPGGSLSAADIFTFLYKIKQYPVNQIVSYFISRYNTKFPDFFKTESIRSIYQMLRSIIDDIDENELKREIIKVLDSYQGPKYLVY